VVYAAALLIVAGVALYVAAPLFGGSGAGAEAEDLELERLTHERSLAVQALKELDFDRQMSKLSERDYAALRAPLEARALAAMSEIERVRLAHAADAERRPAPPPAPHAVPAARTAGKVRYCPQCGRRLRTDANFCIECGAAVSPLRGLAAARAR
jgi:zinc ribbon protein